MIKPTVKKNLYVPVENNMLLKQSLDAVNTNEEIQTLWRVVNINAIDRLHMTDHGPTHFHIVANIGLRIARIFHKRSIPMSVVKNFQLDYEYAEVIIFLACVLHDIGMSVSRAGHEEFSIPLANNLMRELLSFLPIHERTIVVSETLHAIISHRRNGTPATIEAGIVRIADALDMSQGRSRIPYDAGAVNIHSVSARAIDKVAIEEGKNRPVNITISMNNSAGIFQIDELLKEKLNGSGIEQYFEISATIKGKTERKHLSEFHL
jgi:metal-dependent HD superfamily phosphatase/phosphodiesterase